MAPRFTRNRIRTNLWLLAIAIFVLLRVAYDLRSRQPPQSIAEGVYEVARVVDGDTLLLSSGVRVRLQGIDTPESVRPDHPVEPWAAEAHEFTREFVSAAGGTVRLSFGAERLDRYGRSLAFVWHKDRLLNDELVRAGLARARLDYRYSGTMKRRLANAEQEARSASRGIWSTGLTTNRGAN